MLLFGLIIYLLLSAIAFIVGILLANCVITPLLIAVSLYTIKISLECYFNEKNKH